MRKIIIISLILLLFIAGCKFSDIKEKVPVKTTTKGKADFVGGTKGTEVQIVSPVKDGKAYVNQPFQIAIKVSNEGETETEGTICVSGLNPKYFLGFTGCDCQDFALEGQTKLEGETIEGEDEILTFEGGEVVAGDLKKFTVTSTTRYDYKTYGIIKACVKKEAYSDEGCQISPTTNVVKSASSAPITISKITEEIIPQSDDSINMIFNIEISNSGRGDIFSLDASKSECEASEDDEKIIELRLINAPGRAICDPVKLREDEAIARCTVTDVEVFEESYEPEITLELEYAYEIIDSNKFEVVG